VRFAPGALLRVGESALRLAPPGSIGALDTAPDGEGHVRVATGAAAGGGPAPAVPQARDGSGGTTDRPPVVPGQAGAPPMESGDGPPGHGRTADAGAYGEATRTEDPGDAWGPAEEDTPGTGGTRQGTPVRGTDVPRGIRRRGGLGAWARRLAGGRGEPPDAQDPYEQDGEYAEYAEEDAFAPRDPVAVGRAPEKWPDPAALLLTALGPGPRLWERAPEHPEALTVRLGTADRAAPDGSGLLPSVPVTAGLREVGALGLAGPRARLMGLARSVVAQLASLHSPDALELVLISADRHRPVEERTADWGWLGWLPHVRPGHGQDCRLLLAYDRDQATARTDELLRRLEDHAADTGLTAGARAAAPDPAAETSGRPVRRPSWARDDDPADAGFAGPCTVVLVDGDPGGADVREAVVRLALEGPPAGIHVVCLAETEAASPASPVSRTYEAACEVSPAFRECGAVALLSGDVATALRLMRVAPGGSPARQEPREDHARVTDPTGPARTRSADRDPVRETDPGHGSRTHISLLGHLPAGPDAPRRRPGDAPASAGAEPAPGAPAASGPVTPGTVAAVDAVSAAWAERFARALAPLRADGAAGERQARVSAPLPQSARLLDELGLARATPASLMARWADAADDAGALGGRAWAVLGAGPRGPVCADLAADGPHLLIEGPPGSGRTELLRSVAASLAAAERPDRLTVALVDGKDGGGHGTRPGDGLGVCTDLPHVGTHLTANDPVRMREFAQSLSAELKRRAELLGRSDFADWHTRREVSGRMIPQRKATGPARTSADNPSPGAADLDTPPSSTLRLRPSATRARTEPGPPLARLVVIVDDLDALLTPPLGSPGRPAAGSVVRALEAVAREGSRLGVHLVAATAGGTRTEETDLARAATLRVTLEAPAPGPDEPAPGRGRLTVPGRPDTSPPRAVPFQAGRVTGRIPRTATLRPTVVPLDWTRAGDPPARRPVRELGNGPTDLALLASALERAARSVSAQEVPSLL
jgi:DNA segregation ATPase FtsK/SpoIIIE-like protein